MTRRELEALLRDPADVRARAFEAVRCLAREIGDPPDPNDQDLLLRALERRAAFGSSRPVLDALTRAAGLFPYLEPADLSLADLLAYEFHRPLDLDETTTFHRVQGEVYRELLDGRSVVLSAPTSFGKSLIIDAMIATGRYDNIVVVVPTIALIDETRRRLSRFRDRFKVIAHPTQRPAQRNVFVYTQERVVEGLGEHPVDFFVIDEFYKLHPGTEKRRMSILNHAFHRLAKTEAQFYMLGPNISGIPNGFRQRFRCTFLSTDYRTVVSEIRRVKTPRRQRDERLVELMGELQEPTLVYCSSPERVRRVAEALLSEGIGRKRQEMAAAVDWISRNYHSEWLFPRALSRGIGYHHGRLPRALAQLSVRAFNEGHIDTLICTSTLIEGVNTKAKNVVVFDNKVAKRRFDYFTFNNIAGRGGRMFQHFVGNVYVFDDPPQDELPMVDIPAFTQSVGAPESLLIQLPEDTWTPESRRRLGEVLGQKVLPLSVIRKNSGLDPERQIALARDLRSNLGRYSESLAWSHTPSYEQLEEACGLIHRHFVQTKGRLHGVSSGRQLAYLIWRFRRLRVVRNVIEEELAKETARSQGADAIVEDILDFVRYWVSYNFPQYLRALHRIQVHVLGEAGYRPGDFTSLASAIENAFMDPAVYALDEYGLPLELAQRLEGHLDPNGDLDRALEKLRTLEPETLRLQPFEMELIRRAQEGL